MNRKKETRKNWHWQRDEASKQEYKEMQSLAKEDMAKAKRKGICIMSCS